MKNVFFRVKNKFHQVGRKLKLSPVDQPLAILGTGCTKSTTSVPKLSSFSFNFLHKVPDPLKIALYDKHILSSHFPLGTYENCMTSQKTRYSPELTVTTLSIDPLKTFRAGARLLRHPVCRRPLIPSLTLTSPLLTV